jgi:hypothetical protein
MIVSMDDVEFIDKAGVSMNMNDAETHSTGLHIEGSSVDVHFSMPQLHRNKQEIIIMQQQKQQANLWVRGRICAFQSGTGWPEGAERRMQRSVSAQQMILSGLEMSPGKKF